MTDFIRVSIAYPTGRVQRYEFDLSTPQALETAVIGLTLSMDPLLQDGRHLVYVNGVLLEDWLDGVITTEPWDVQVLLKN